MLTIHRVVARAAEQYAGYMTAVEQHGDYYVGADGDPWGSPGAWMGALAARLGLRGAIGRETLRLVMAGQDPRGGAVAVRVPHRGVAPDEVPVTGGGQDPRRGGHQLGDVAAHRWGVCRGPSPFCTAGL